LNLKRWIGILVLLTVSVIAVFSFLRSVPPTVPFGKASRQDLVSTLITNGQVAPQAAVEMRAESGGRVTAIPVQQGQMVAVGQQLVALDAAEALAKVAEVQLTLQSAEQRLQQLRAGGAPLAQAELDSTLRRTNLQLEQAQREAAVLEKLVQQKAATSEELRRQQEEVDRLKAQRDGLSQQRAVLVSPADRASAESAVGQARAALAEARRMASLRSIRSPMAGLLYEFTVRPGAFLQPGDLVGRVGDLDAVRVSVFVDEPELGKLQLGQPVVIRWDARAGQTWKGEVNQLPTRIQAFGTRQVGEVVCRIANPGRELLPGTNVNVEIETARVQNALTIPKQAMRRRLGVDGVWKLAGDRLAWQEISPGVSNLTAVQVNQGLQEGDSVVLVYDRELTEGMAVTPAFP
jgi:HlyD family secretion protein